MRAKYKVMPLSLIRRLSFWNLVIVSEARALQSLNIQNLQFITSSIMQVVSKALRSWILSDCRARSSLAFTKFQDDLGLMYGAYFSRDLRAGLCVIDTPSRST